MANIFCGPYSLYKKQSNGKYESVISICIMNDFSLSERLYQDQKLINTSITRSTSLEKAIQNAISRLEKLMQLE